MSVTIEGNLSVGELYVETFNPPSSGASNGAFASGLEVNRFWHQDVLLDTQVATPTNRTIYQKMSRGITQILEVRVVYAIKPSGNRGYTLDLQSFAQGGAWTSVFAAPIRIDANSIPTASGPIGASIRYYYPTAATSSFAANTLFRTVCTLFGDTGTYGTLYNMSIWYAEAPNKTITIP